MNKDVPIWEKYALTIREAAVYFHIGEMNIRKIVADNADAESRKVGYTSSQGSGQTMDKMIFRY